MLQNVFQYIKIFVFIHVTFIEIIVTNLY